MKKVLLSAIAVMAFGVSNAQEETSSYKPTMGTVTTEVNLTGGLNNANFNLNTGGVKFRYFLQEDMALRLGLGVNSSKEINTDNSDPANIETETIKSSTSFLTVGVEKHFAGSDRLSTYAGADLVVGFRGASYELKDNTTTLAVDGSDSPVPNAGNRAGTEFGVRVLTGADYYIAKKVYIGVEAGLQFASGKDKDVVTSLTGAPSVTATGGKVGGLSTNIIGGVRLGFQF